MAAVNVRRLSSPGTSLGLAAMVEPGGISDAQLLERFAKARDAEAFQQIVQRHGALVFNACRRLLGDAHRAEDATQAVFLILVQKAGTLSPKTVLAGWLYQTAIHVTRTAK